MQNMESRQQRLRRNKTALCIAAACGAMQIAGMSIAIADDNTSAMDLGSVRASGEASQEQAWSADSAPSQAPSSAPLEASQPTSVVSQHYIENSVAQTANYDEALKYTPSVYSISPGGASTGKNETLSIRGFQDGQYNVTFDGIPFGDAVDFHHTTSAYFMASDLKEAEIDRGPGTASTIGNATFGGTIGLLSKDPLSEKTLNPYASIGSYGTRSEGIEYNTGTLQNGLAMFLDVQRVDSDGYLTNTPMRRDNVFFKGTMPVGENTLLTFAYTKNSTYGYTAQGATVAQIAQFGPNYGLNAKPNTQGYYGYNWSNYASDFAYIGAESDMGNGWRIEDKLYATGFEHNYVGGKDGSDNNPADNSVKYYLAPNYTSAYAPYNNDVPGKVSDARFRAVGNIVRFYKDLQSGQLQFGLWYDYNDDSRYSYAADMTQGGIPVPAKTTGVAYSYLIHDTLTTIQPYIQYDWKASSALTLTMGVKEAYFARSLDAPYNKTKPPVPVNYDATYNALLPSVAAHYTIQPGWTAYAQAAEGFLAPPITVLEVQQVSTVAPQQTMNYQAGTAWKSDRLALGGDVYYIDYSNYLAQSLISTPTGNETTYINGGGAVFKGVEFEATYRIGGGFNLYGNASFNSAIYKNSNVWVAQTPRTIQTLGAIYNHAGWYSSLMAKRYGQQYGLDNTTNTAGNLVFQDQYYIGSFTTTDFALGYTFKSPASWSKEVAVKLNVNNVFDNKSISGFAGTQSVGGQALYWTNPGRGVFLSLSTKI